MNAVISVVGKDTVGILAKVAAVCAEQKANVIDVSQTVLQKMFCMIMIVEVQTGSDIASLRAALKAMGEAAGLQIHVMHEDVFDSMHHV